MGALLKTNAQEIILIRHAKVAQDHSGWMGVKKARQLHRSYDTSPIHQFSSDSVLAKIPARQTDTVYVSGLPRSIGTGIKLFGETATLVSMDLFNEFDMHIAGIPLFLPYKGWTGISRILWLAGAKKRGVESFAEAKERVELAANFIEEKVKNRQQIILVTHGFINRNISKELKKRGWKIVQNNGKENLGATVLRK